jgi:hypothetical protein
MLGEAVHTGLRDPLLPWSAFAANPPRVGGDRQRDPPVNWNTSLVNHASRQQHA